MVFKCQENSFLKELIAKVTFCEKATFKDENGIIRQGYNVILDDTILFPEGGGQPCDYGTLNGKQVWDVKRKNIDAIHFVECDTPFSIGEEVKEILNWSRRLDHMQQHSGQHLITALFDREFGYDTKSWCLGSETSYIELNAKDITKEEIVHLENIANDLIIEGRNVTVELKSYEEGLKFQDIRAPRGLPEDHVGPVRVVSIEGIESNMCCGIHVKNLTQLQCIKLLHTEKTKNKLLVHFLVGRRTLRKLEKCYDRELSLNKILKGCPLGHVDLILKMQANQKILQKNLQKLLKEFAITEAEKVKAMETLPKFYILHRKDGIDIDFINTFLRNAPSNVFYFLSVADLTFIKGYIALSGDSATVQTFGPIFAELLDGKGNAKGNLYQAKVNNLKKLNECDALLKKHFETVNDSM